MSQSPTEMNDLLESWGLSDLKAKFKANYIVLEALEYLTEADVIELIPKIGQRAIFRAKLHQWRQDKLKPPVQSVTSTETCTPESKKIKLEPVIELASSPPSSPQQQQQKQQQQQQQQIQPSPPEHVQQQQQLQQDQQSAWMEQMISQAKSHLIKKGNVTPRNIIAKPTKPKRISKKMLNNVDNQPPTIQSRVQQFIIGSSPPPATMAPTAVIPQITTSTPTQIEATGICRLPTLKQPSNNTLNAPRLSLKSPSQLFSSERLFAGRRMPVGAMPRLRPPIPHVTPPARIINSDNLNSHVPHLMQPGRIINSDNLSPCNPMVRIPAPPSNFDADLTPFATSIIRVETNDNESLASGMPSTQNQLPKMKRTTIIQKLNDKNASPLNTKPTNQIHPSMIMPKPMVQLQKLSPEPKVHSSYGKSPSSMCVPLPARTIRTAKSPAYTLRKSPELPRPKVLIVPKSEPVDEEQIEKLKKLSEEQMTKTAPAEAKPQSSFDFEREEEMEIDPPEIEEITLADSLAELPDAIKDETNDSDSNSDADNSQQDDNDSREADELKENTDSQGGSQVDSLTDSQADSQAPKGENRKLDIRKVLTNSRSGRKVIKRYVAEEIFDETIRKVLIETIAIYCFENKIHITPTYCKVIAEEIIEMFPNERLEDYIQRKGKKLRSPLYTKFLGIKKEFARKAGLKTSANGKEDNDSKSTSAKDMEYDEDDNLIIS